MTVNNQHSSMVKSSKYFYFPKLERILSISCISFKNRMKIEGATQGNNLVHCAVKITTLIILLWLKADLIIPAFCVIKLYATLGTL